MSTHYKSRENNSLISKILKRLRLKEDNRGCQAIIDKNPRLQLCENKVMGETCRIRYCRQHAPSGASLGLIRTNAVEFYCFHKNKIVKKE